MSFHAAEILGEERASCLPSSRSTVLMKLSSGRVSRTNRRFNFLNALISPGWDIGPSLYPVIPSRRMRRCLGSNRWRSRPRGRKRDRVRFLVSRKKVSPWRRRGEGGAGGEEVERGRAHARATVGCRRHVSSRATRATWPSLPALLSASRLFLNCIITIIMPNGNYNLRTNHVSQLQPGESNRSLFLFCASSCSSCFYLSGRVTGFFVTFVVWIRAVCNLLNRLCSPRCAKMQ